MQGPTIRNILTVDVEDWTQSVLDVNAPLTDCFIANTHKVLEHFVERAVCATFFVLGLAAEKAPRLVREICKAGHEVQSHGYGHRLIRTQTPREFAEDVTRSKKLLEDITGRRVTGYRAPAFSIGRTTLWALDILLDCGFEYDSSLCPVQTPRYGIEGIPRSMHLLHTPLGRQIIELPVATYRAMGQLAPAGGGGYARLWPYPILRGAVRQLNALGAPAVMYLHPYEYNPVELGSLPVRIPWRLRLHQSMGRRHVRGRVDRLIREFSWGPANHWTANSGPIPRFDCASLDPSPTRSAGVADGDTIGQRPTVLRFGA